MKKYFLLLSLVVTSMFGQVQDTTLAYEYPYILPIWGQKAADRGIKLQKPFGVNVNYVHNVMELGISEFGMSLGTDPNSNVNQIIAEHVNLETLNFKKTEAITNGVNVRADVWILPFMNVYGMYSRSSGSTSVSLEPTWYDDNGNLVLQLPAFTSTVDFEANSYGFGTTLVYGIGDYFISADANYTLSSSEILSEPAQFLVASSRIGERFEFKNQMKLSLYVGAMWRGFVEADGNSGIVYFDDVFPEMGSQVDAKISDNNDRISDIGTPSSPSEIAEKYNLEKQNEVLTEVSGAIDQVEETDINYSIKKDIVNNWSVQFGFNFELTPDVMVRGEFGKGTGNSFAMVGLQYRFGH